MDLARKLLAMVPTTPPSVEAMWRAYVEARFADAGSAAVALMSTAERPEGVRRDVFAVGVAAAERTGALPSSAPPLAAAWITEACVTRAFARFDWAAVRHWLGVLASTTSPSAGAAAALLSALPERATDPFVDGDAGSSALAESARKALSALRDPTQRPGVLRARVGALIDRCGLGASAKIPLSFHFTPSAPPAARVSSDLADPAFVACMSSEAAVLLGDVQEELHAEIEQ
jgi:hypothetical protein